MPEMVVSDSKFDLNLKILKKGAISIVYVFLLDISCSP